MLKNITAILFVILVAAIFIGCEGEHSTRSVKRFVRKNISKSPINITAPERGKYDWKYWIINFEDRPDYKFWVESVKSSVFGIPAGYDLWTNYDNIFSYYYLNEFKAKNNCLLSPKLDDTVHNTGKYDIEAYYSSKEEAHILAEDINKYCDFINQQKYPCRIKILCYYLPAQNDNQIKDYKIKLYSSVEYARAIDWTSPNDDNARYLDKINVEDELLKHIEIYYDIKKDYESQIEQHGKILHYRRY
jgi:hypothetical protein